MPSAKDQGEVLLRAVLESPDDDAPRLAYADWLEKQGGAAVAARAEFIRIQIQSARTPGDDLRQREWVPRELRLIRKFQRHWLKAIPGYEQMYWGWQRGFVADVSCSASQFLTAAEVLRSLEPIESVSLKLLGKRARELFACPHLAGIRFMHLRKPGEEGALELARCRSLSALNVLILEQGVGPVGAKALAESPHLANLTHLSLLQAGIDDAGVEAVAGSPFLRRLGELGLTHDTIGPVGARALAASPNLSGVTDLDLTSNQLGDDGLRLLLGSKHLMRLKGLKVGYNGITDPGAAVIAAWRGLVKFEVLDFRGNRLTDVGALAFARSKWTRNLRDLLLDGEITPDAVTALQAAQNLQQTRLGINNHLVDDVKGQR